MLLLGVGLKQHRTPIDAAAALTFDCADESISNKTGINTRSLLDMQKFIACSSLLHNPSFDNKAKQQLKIVASGTAYSARTSLVFKSSEPLRHVTFGGG